MTSGRHPHHSTGLSTIRGLCHSENQQTPGIDYDIYLRRYGLARLHPLLAHAMRLREANSVTAMVTPLALHFPVETLTIKVSPLKLQIKGNKLMRGAMRLLENRCPSHYTPY